MTKHNLESPDQDSGQQAGLEVVLHPVGPLPSGWWVLHQKNPERDHLQPGLPWSYRFSYLEAQEHESQSR